jgi:methionyl-tRNA formyltransferase
LSKIKIVFCTYPSVYSDLVLEKLLQSSHIKIVAIVESNRILRKNGYALIDNWLLLKKVGLCYATYLFLVTSGYSILSIFSERKRFIRSQLKQKNIKIIKTKNINNLTINMKNYKPDYLLSAHFNQLIENNILAIPKYGCINIHPGLLPDYKGVDPAFYMLLRDEKQVGVTLHYQDEFFDTGSIIKKTEYNFNSKISLFLLNCNLFILGVNDLLNLLKTYSELPSMNICKSNSNYDSWPNKDNVNKLLKKYSLINVKNFSQALK